MYAWLSDALQDSSQVVTASRRLARALSIEFGQQQIAAGKTAWRTPAIYYWQDWLNERMATSQAPQDLPTRINSHQSRVLWERCLGREISDPLLNLGVLVRQARDTWMRLHEWDASIDDCAQSAQGQDQRLFVRAAGHYQSILNRENWIDDSGISSLVVQLIATGRVSVPSRIVLAGFDRIVPQVQRVLDQLGAAGCAVDTAPTPARVDNSKLHRYENEDAEMRAAGAWARRALDENPTQRVAIVASNLELDALRRGRLVREGMVPGWQYASGQYASAVNVSYGRSLINYAAIGIAMLALRWLQSDLGTRDISLLLRSQSIGTQVVPGRARLELNLRQLPDRNWTPQMLLGALQGCDKSADSLDWLRRINELGAIRSELPKRAAPSKWAVVIDELLLKLNWPGEKVLDSIEFQLVNRWRELLNDLARLELVSPSMTFAEVMTRLRTMASETIFQAESSGALVHLLGPLEAAGMEFDALWVCGVTAANWPPVNRPLALVSRELQRSLGMPDAEPQDTLEYAQRVLSRIARSAAKVVFSFPQTAGDAEQTVTALLEDVMVDYESAPIDPGWHAVALCSVKHAAAVLDDPVPSVAVGEIVAGGATTIQRQMAEPFSAFAFGRLRVNRLQIISHGLSAALRGSLIHGALQNLYAELPSQQEIADWTANELRARIENALQIVFLRHERYVDPVLQQLFLMERHRVASLLVSLVALDVERAAFKIVNVERKLEVELSGARFGLRADRIDRLEDGSLVILDYKTGEKKRFLDGQGEPTEIQLVVYACAIKEYVSGLALVNIDSRLIGIDGAGIPFSTGDNWDEDLDKWKTQVAGAAAGIQRGDVRINVLQGIETARPLGLLSRIEELRHDR